MKTEKPERWSEDEWRIVQANEAQSILHACDGGKPVGNGNLATVLVLFRLWLIGTNGTTKRGREYMRR